MDSLIAAKDKPVSGITQPDNGAPYELRFSGMPRRRKILPALDTPESIMRVKIEARLEVMFPKAKGRTQQYEMLARVATVGPETIRTFMVGERSPTLKNIVKIAEAVGLSLPELFTKDTQSAENGAADELNSYLHRR